MHNPAFHLIHLPEGINCNSYSRSVALQR